MRVRLLDGHCDTAFELWRRGESLLHNTCHVDLEKADRLENYAQIFAFCSYAGQEGVFRRPEDALDLPLRYLRRELDSHSDRIAAADDAESVLAAWKAGKTAALLSLEGPESIGCAPERLFELRAQGFVMTTLTWNSDNALAGCHLSDTGLLAQGRAFVRAAEECGILLDVSHLSERAFWQLCEAAQRPILASHSNCRALCGHSRNLTDDQLRAVAQLGGTVGLNLYPPFLGENAGFDALLAHLEHMLSICGEGHVALGGDLDGCDELAAGFENVGSYVSFYDYLRSQGYGEDLLDRIFYENLLKLL